jgi:phage-related protein
MEQLAQKGILGLGEVMGDTAADKMTIMQTALGNLQEVAGTGLLDALKGVFDRITEFASDPRTIQFFTDLGTQIGDFASTLLDKLPDIMTAVQEVGDWFVNNKPLIVGILAALGVAVAAFAFTVISSAISAAVALAPILLVMALIGAGAALLFTAWTENWGGIQEKVGELWAVIQPIFDSLVEWLNVNIPIALQYLADIWNNVLLPAIQEVFNWIVSNLVPLWISQIQWPQTNLPIALAALSEFWTNVLYLPSRPSGNGSNRTWCRCL